MGTSKNTKAAILIIGIILIPFLIYKQIKVADYNQYPGVITGFTESNSYTPGFRGPATNETRVLPQLEYYTPKDTFAFDVGDMIILSYDKGDKVTVLEKKDNPDKAVLYSFWSYYMSVPELITIMLISGVTFGIYFYFANPER
jgi:hypothetical protein